MTKFKTLAVSAVLTTITACGGGDSGNTPFVTPQSTAGGTTTAGTTTAGTTTAGTTTAGTTTAGTTTAGTTTGGLAALSCSGSRLWDAGTSDVIQDAISYVSESGQNPVGNSKFPCAVFWEYSSSENCSLIFTYEEYLSTFGLQDFLQEIGTMGADFVAVRTDGSRQTAPPGNISVTDLNSLPDCELI